MHTPNSYDSDGALMAHEDTDAPMEHWYTAIFDRAKITRTQGLLLVETYRLCEGHIGQLRTERAALFKRLPSASSACEPGAACAGPQSGGSATACGDVAAQGGICAALEGNTSAELAIIILTWLVLPTIFSPPQWARVRVQGGWGGGYTGSGRVDVAFNLLCFVTHLHAPRSPTSLPQHSSSAAAGHSQRTKE